MRTGRSEFERRVIALFSADVGLGVVLFGVGVRIAGEERLCLEEPATLESLDTLSAYSLAKR